MAISSNGEPSVHKRPALDPKQAQELLVLGEADRELGGALSEKFGMKLDVLERLDFLLEGAQARRSRALLELHHHRETMGGESTGGCVRD